VIDSSSGRKVGNENFNGYWLKDFGARRGYNINPSENRKGLQAGETSQSYERFRYLVHREDDSSFVCNGTITLRTTALN